MDKRGHPRTLAPMDASKPHQVRVNVSAAVSDVLARLEKESPALSKTQWMTVLLDAAAAAVAENGHTFRFPLRFQIVDWKDEIPVTSGRRR